MGRWWSGSAGCRRTTPRTREPAMRNCGCVTRRSWPRSPLFFFNDTATPEIYTLSLHDALPIWVGTFPLQVLRPHAAPGGGGGLSLVVLLAGGLLDGDAASIDVVVEAGARLALRTQAADRKSTRLNSSHPSISYAVFCLKKKIHYILISYQGSATRRTQLPCPVSRTDPLRTSLLSSHASHQNPVLSPLTRPDRRNILLTM